MINTKCRSGAMAARETPNLEVPGSSPGFDHVRFVPTNHTLRYLGENHSLAKHTKILKKLYGVFNTSAHP